MDPNETLRALMESLERCGRETGEDEIEKRSDVLVCLYALTSWLEKEGFMPEVKYLSGMKEVGYKLKLPAGRKWD